ncbi:MAG: hypothetical protein FJX30_02315 [Alphaproteobacteria bacterium]|nr:hypothetical protein [Alphaproteobacteria bacterium]
MGKVFSLLACAILIQSCVNPDYLKYGKVSFQATAQNNFFTYTVDDSFYKKYKNSANNKNHPRLSDEEFKMLNVLLKEKKYCIKNSFNPSFEILSRQEKIYDATFAKLIAENYNSKSVSPVSYYGRCL